VENPEVFSVFSCGSVLDCLISHLSQMRKGIYKWQEVSKRNKASYPVGQRLCVRCRFGQAFSLRDAGWHLQPAM